MAFRVKIISPIRATEADIKRRQQRYSEHAFPDTKVKVFNLDEGPVALNTSGDLIFSEYAVFQEGVKTNRKDFDAILIDCVLDPALDALQEEVGLPTFGATRTTLPLVSIVAQKFSIITRIEKQCEMLAELVKKYGYGDRLVSKRVLGITYEEAKQEKIFNEAMIRQLKCVVEEDRGHGVIMGSTTMALAEEVVLAARGMPLFFPGMIALRAMEILWKDGLIA
jgi:allantoin racemase